MMAVLEADHVFLAIAELILIGAAAYFLSNIVSEHIAGKAAKKMADKKANLIPTVIKDGQIVPDITEGLLNPPAIITFYRDSSFGAFIIPIKYVFNNKDIIKIGSGKSVTITTTSAINTFTTKETQKDFNDTSLIEFVARPGEHISIHYKSFRFDRVQRHSVV